MLKFIFGAVAGGLLATIAYEARMAQEKILDITNVDIDSPYDVTDRRVLGDRKTLLHAMLGGYGPNKSIKNAATYNDRYLTETARLDNLYEAQYSPNPSAHEQYRNETERVFKAHTTGWKTDSE